MVNRKRNIQMKIYVTEEEKRLIDEKMAQLPTRRYGAYLRKMAIDGFIIYTDTTDQERFTRMKTLGVDYTEEAITVRIAGGTRHTRTPKQRDDRIRLLYDIQSKQGAGLQHWAKIQNLKLAAKTMNFLTEHGIESYSELEAKLDVLINQRDVALSQIKEIERRTAELTLVMKHAATYRQLKPMYDRYRQSRDKEKFLHGHESEIILFEATTRELKRMDAVPLPSTESMNKELAELTAKKDALLAEYRVARSEAQEYETIRQNVDALLSTSKEQKQRCAYELD